MCHLPYLGFRSIAFLTVLHFVTFHLPTLIVIALPYLILSIYTRFMLLFLVSIPYLILFILHSQLN